MILTALFRPRTPSAPRLLLSPALLADSIVTAHAASACVDSVSAFYAALNTAHNQPSDQPFQIKLVPGTDSFAS